MGPLPEFISEQKAAKANFPIKFTDPGSDDTHRELPEISEDTQKQLLTELNFAPNPDADYLNQVPIYHPIWLARKMMERQVSLLQNLDRPTEDGVYNVIVDWLGRAFKEDNNINAASFGLGVVLRAFHIQTGVGFIDKLKNLPPVQMSNFLNRSTADSAVLNGVYIRRLEKTPGTTHRAGQFPSYQSNLEYCCEKLAYCCAPYTIPVLSGAIATYNLLDEFKGQLWYKVPQNTGGKSQ